MCYKTVVSGEKYSRMNGNGSARGGLVTILSQEFKVDLVVKVRLHAEGISLECSLQCAPRALDTSCKNLPQWLWSASRRRANMSDSTSASPEPSQGLVSKGLTYAGLEQQL